MLEIIEFRRPVESSKNLYITNISNELGEDVLTSYLEKSFSAFGLLYEVQVCSGADLRSLYAFVKFYSSQAAARALHMTRGQLYLGGQHLKVKYVCRKKEVEALPLYVCKCYELANYYLGFNAWNTSIASMTEVSAGADNSSTVAYVCRVNLDIRNCLLHVEGCGFASQNHDDQHSSDAGSRSAAVCRAMKRAHQYAVENAFSQLLLVLLDSGKVFVDINSTVIDDSSQLSATHNQQLHLQLLQVTEVDAAAGDDDVDDDDNCLIDAMTSLADTDA